MKSTANIMAIAAIAAMLVSGGTSGAADAKGFDKGGHGGHNFGHNFGHGSKNHKFGGHHFGGHNFGVKFAPDHQRCWRFGKWICGPGGY